MLRTFLSFVLIIGLVRTPLAMGEDLAPPALAEARTRVQAELDRLDAGLRQAAGRLGGSGLTGAAARSALTGLCGDFSWALDCAAIDATGTMVTMEPAAYRSFEGTSIASQEQVAAMLREHKAVMSTVFMTVEKVAAVDVEYPVINREGKFLGAVSLLFRPEKMLATAMLPATRGVPLEMIVMEPGGRILYEKDPGQVGLNLFTAPLYRSYPSLLEVGRQIARQESGAGVYRYLDDRGRKTVAKDAFWQTASLYGTSWRVVGAHPVTAASAAATDPAARERLGGKLETLARSKALVAALARGDRAKALGLFRKFAAANPGLYAVEWLDDTGVARFGYPRENSLSGYDFRARQTPDHQQVVTLVAGRKPATVEAPLFEGGEGVFIYRPVFAGKRYLGMVYLILLKEGRGTDDGQPGS